MTPPLLNKREPCRSELAAATVLVDHLRRITAPQVDRTIAASDSPGNGRINMRQAMLLSQQVAGRKPVTAKPFYKQRLEVTPSCRPIVGIMGDCSASMGLGMERLGVVRWIITQAVHTVGGEVAAVLFGDDGYPIQRSYQRVPHVETFAATGAKENFPDGFALIDAEVDLWSHSGPRMLVVITDGHFVSSSAVSYAEQAIPALVEAGVLVLFVPASHRFRREDGYGAGPESVMKTVASTDPITLASQIGEALVALYKR